MRIIVQNVTEAHLSISNRLFCATERGYVLLVGFTFGDNKETALKMAEKVINMRLFQDNNGKTNLSIIDIKGTIMAVPQFTLYADLSEGRRPSFTKALSPNEASRLFDYFVDEIKKRYDVVCTGLFGSDMKVNLTNDGPFTVLLDSKELFK
ncbi:MAG: D-aminoacyl-tRNA deacylase [Bacilli bacterium]|jgi:D-tyrosyl-tRNA(Tyr) deacylase|nr:D-aminoacyl-tRNA deacylase [Bacilli bacterium]